MVIRQTDYDEKGVLRLAAVCVNGEMPGTVTLSIARRC